MEWFGKSWSTCFSKRKRRSQTRSKASARYAADFAALGPKDHKDVHVRDLDMKTRMFKYPCSFLIYSEQFDALPQSAKDKLYHRLRERLTEPKAPGCNRRF
jgi:hypothetical protein